MAAEVIPGIVDVELVRQNYLSAQLYLSDHRETILVEGRGPGVCGAANCPAYVLEKRGQSCRLLLDAEEVQQVHVLNSVTNGYHDIQTDMHGSATLSDLFIYRYDGRQYRLKECLSREYTLDVDEKGEARSSAKPMITHMACRR